MKTNNFFIISILFSGFILTGCASNDKITKVYAPNEQLDDVLIKYAVINEPQSSCESNMPGSDNNIACESIQQAPVAAKEIRVNLNCHDNKKPVVDCFRLASDLNALYLQYPNHKRIMMMTALVEFEIGNNNASQQLLDLILSKRGAYPEAAILRSRIAMEEGNLSLARTIIKRQLNISPYNPYLHELQAAYYYVEGKYTEALQAIKSAEHFIARDWRMSYHRGIIYEAQKQWYKACKEYTGVLKSQPNNQMINAKVLLLQEHVRCSAS